MTEPSRSSYRWVVLTCGALAFSTSYLVRYSHSGIAKYLQLDLGLNKAHLGILGSAFFWPYATMQIPWGALTDRLGGRMTVAGGTLLTGIFIGWFALATDLNSALLSRAAVGVFSASVYVPMAAVCARWFVSRERGLANSFYHGPGGGLGELLALYAMPHIAASLIAQKTVFGLSGWRGSVLCVAAIVGVIGVLCAVFLRSGPRRIAPEASGPTQLYSRAAQRSLYDIRLWLLVGVFISFTMSIRLIGNWLSVYTADLFAEGRALALHDAVRVAANVVGLPIVAGRIIGEPIMGRVSDAALRRGWSRGWIMSASLSSTAVIFFLLMLRPVPNELFLSLIAFSIGAFGNSAPIVNAAISDTFGESVSGFALGVVNTIGQLTGALALTLSGWIAIQLNPAPGNNIAEYMPIWWLGMGSCGLGIVTGVIFALIPRRTSERVGEI